MQKALEKLCVLLDKGCGELSTLKLEGDIFLAEVYQGILSMGREIPNITK